MGKQSLVWLKRDIRNENMWNETQGPKRDKKKKKRGGTLPQITNTEETSEMLAAAWDDYLTVLPSNDNGVILLTLSAPDFCCLTCHLCLLMTSVSCQQYKRQNSLLSHRFSHYARPDKNHRGVFLNTTQLLKINTLNGNKDALFLPTSICFSSRALTLCMAYIAGSSEDAKQTGHSSYSSLSSFMRTRTSQITWQNDRDSNNVAAEDSSTDPRLEDTTCRPLWPLWTRPLPLF